MKNILKREPVDHQSGYLGNSRVVLNQFDVSTQADIQHQNLNHSAQDEIMGRLYGSEKHINHLNGKNVAHYSKQDILEQYCISERGLGALENENSRIFGCLSSHQSSPCSARNASSFFTACMRQKVSSDENLYELYKRHPNEYAPFPKRHRYPWSSVTPEIYSYDRDLKNSYFRRKPYPDPSRYTWMPSDDESIKMEKPKSIIDLSYRSSMMSQSKKHVSFARSHTLTSFDDTMSSLSSSSSHLNRITRSQERLLEVRKAEGLQAITKQPELLENKAIMDKVKRGPMKTQATQTETFLGKKPLLAHINLSPRTVQRVKMVSQAAQTNGINGRKLMKSLSEAGKKFPSSPNQETDFMKSLEHEPLQRTQSDEPPRSPFLVTSPPVPLPQETQLPSETSSLSKSEDHESEDSGEIKKEIFIDFKPQVSFTSSSSTKRPLIKTASDGVILLEQRKIYKSEDCVVPNVRPYSSISHENLQVEEEEPQKYTAYFQRIPIKNEGIFKQLDEHNIYSSVDESLRPQDSVDEEFHENIFYKKIFDRQDSTDIENMKDDIVYPIDESIVPSIFLRPELKLSPFTSSDSIANDTRDQSDDIWNESQVTVLQIDSGTDNGTGLSTSEITPLSSTVSSSLLTPSSKRKHLLMMQHQQRSSFDTEGLEEEPKDDSFSSQLVIDKSYNKLQVPGSLPIGTSRLTQPAVSPSRRRKFSDSPPVPVESPLPAVVPDLLLARTDSCKTTDLSESTTTDDYITANSGTDSSRKSTSCQGLEKQLAQKHIHQQTSKRGKHQNDGSSSTSKILDKIGMDDMVVPSLSPSFSPEVGYLADAKSNSTSCYTPVPQIRTGRSTPSEDSSSCGSYSIGASTPDLLERYTVPSGKPDKIWSDDEERSLQYSSSGYYESPVEDQKRNQLSNTTKKRSKSGLINPDLTNTYPKSSNHNNTNHKSKQKAEIKISPSKENVKGKNDKIKRSKARTRSPMQGNKISFQGRKSPHKDKLLITDEKVYKVTSDESSTGQDYSISETQRKIKKNKDTSRRKSLPRSPSSQKVQKKSEIDYQPSSLPGSLSRRKSNKSSKCASTENENNQKLSCSNYLRRSETPICSSKDTTTLKALSAESLRSVSPGSDSVFYSDPSSHTAADHQFHCLHCGKEVDMHPDDAEKSSNGQQQHIVQPPAGFEDSPKIKGGRLFKKLDKRLKSEEKGHSDYKRHKYRPDMRAKSEERGGCTKNFQGRLRPMQRSPFCSKEHLKSADSSPSILPGDPEEDDDHGLYQAGYVSGMWLCVHETETIYGTLSPTESEQVRRSSISSTESEHELCKRYQAITHRIVHRKPYVDMYKRLHFRTFDSDKTIVVQRESGEFGFRIHGSKPVVVTAIEPGTPAESSGLEVGDIIITVNRVNVLEKSHSDVVQIAHAGSDTLTLEVARTSYALNKEDEESEPGTIFSGYLWKLSGFAKGEPTNKYIRRWFCLKKNNCLYYYKTDSDKQPVGVVMLFDQKVVELESDAEPMKANTFLIRSEDSVPLYLAADTKEIRNRWVDLIEKSINDSQAVDTYLEETKRNISIAPSSIRDPDCFGYLIKLGTQWKSWCRQYCVLKDAAMYFYPDANATNATGVALLHGYKVQQISSSKKYAFEVIPPDNDKKHYYFHAESDTDRRRWISALEYSIDRWLKIY
ncbi:unnamed protein product [Ceutorhynchus assimilis]|uniref:Uncharacterized protein n=1 Tax=Ceutorhynchus assimilis TaxID=467358 RepID=A0A9N9MMU8_9CUCU|nr:unnamed protein product [Ceutorhynchus assimilis]